jgi:hypothetical protein
MKKSLLMLSCLISFSTLSTEEFNVMFDDGVKKVIHTKEGVLSKAELNVYGKKECKTEKFCLIWFYPTNKDAQKGVEVIESDMFAESANLYSIFSKNKVDNKIICYRPEKGC